MLYPVSTIRLSFIAIFLSLAWKAVFASDYVGDQRDAGEQLASKCLFSHQKLACFKEEGFSCVSVGEPSWNSYSCYISLGGGCYRTRFQLTAVGWSSKDQWLTGECEDTHKSKLQPGVRMMFDNTNAPDSVRLRQLLSSVFRESIQSSDDRAPWSYIAPGANADTDFERISTYFVSKYWEIENQIHDAQVSLLCEDELPRFKDSRLRDVFDAFDDLMLETYAGHLPSMRERFDDDESFDLDAALYGFPGSFSVNILKTGGLVDDLYNEAVRFCTTPFSMNFTKVEDVE